MIKILRQYYSSSDTDGAGRYAKEAGARFGIAKSDFKTKFLYHKQYEMMTKVEAMVHLVFAYVSLKFHQLNAKIVTKVSHILSKNVKDQEVKDQEVKDQAATKTQKEVKDQVAASDLAPTKVTAVVGFSSNFRATPSSYKI